MFLAVPNHICAALPVGAPLRSGFADNDRCVFAIQIGKLEKP